MNEPFKLAELWEYMVECRIACYELDYPFSESRYSTIKEYEKETQRDFESDFQQWLFDKDMAGM